MKINKLYIAAYSLIDLNVLYAFISRLLSVDLFVVIRTNKTAIFFLKEEFPSSGLYLCGFCFVLYVSAKAVVLSHWHKARKCSKELSK